MKLLKGLIIFFSLVGLFYATISIISFARIQSEAKHYSKSCLLIQPGMTVRQVREIMGDNKWNSMENSPQLYYNYSEPDPSYELDYPTVFGGSGWPIISFDTLNLRVKKVNCSVD
jgi:hypothetical protein